MADLSSTDKLKLEKLLGMESGYVLDFSNRSFEQFVFENTGRNIYSKGYDVNGTSKANRLRTFWEINNNSIVGKLIEELLNHLMVNKLLEDQILTFKEQSLFDECLLIAKRLLSDDPQTKTTNPNQTKEPSIEKRLQICWICSMF